jgi:hypothetical protein
MKPGRKQPIKLESLTAKLKVEIETARQQIKVQAEQIAESPNCSADTEARPDMAMIHLQASASIYHAESTFLIVTYNQAMASNNPARIILLHTQQLVADGLAKWVGRPPAPPNHIQGAT